MIKLVTRTYTDENRNVLKVEYAPEGDARWFETEVEARAEGAWQALATEAGTQMAGCVRTCITHHRREFVRFLQDIGIAHEVFMPASVDFIVRGGPFEHEDETYVCVPLDLYNAQAAALDEIRGLARRGSGVFNAVDAREWCGRHDINWNDDQQEAAAE